MDIQKQSGNENFENKWVVQDSKEAFTIALIVRHPGFTKAFYLEIDACAFGLEAILL